MFIGGLERGTQGEVVIVMVTSLKLYARLEFEAFTLPSLTVSGMIELAGPEF